MLRSRSFEADPATAERIRQLLAPRSAGWVPPPAEPSDLSRKPEDRPAEGPPPAAALPTPEVQPDPPPASGDADGPPPAATLPTPEVQRDLPPASGDADGQPVGGGPVRARRGGPRRRALDGLLARARLDLTGGAVAGLLVVALLAAALAGFVVLRGRPQEVQAPQLMSPGTALPGATTAPRAPGAASRAGPARPPAAPPTDAELVVAVVGKVAKPGLVRVPGGSRVDDAVRAAGGAQPGVDLAGLNLARKLVDGEQVLVGVDPPPGTATAPGSATPGAATATGPLNLNAASATELDALPGIGPVLAQRIVDWRTEHGRFDTVEQLREVKGIGESTFADLEGAVVV